MKIQKNVVGCWVMGCWVMGVGCWVLGDDGLLGCWGVEGLELINT